MSYDYDRRTAALRFGEPDLNTPVSGKAHLVLDGYPLFDDANFVVPQGKKPTDLIESYLTKLLGKHKMTFVQAKNPRSTKTLDVKSAKYKVTLEDGTSATIEVELAVKKT